MSTAIDQVKKSSRARMDFYASPSIDLILAPWGFGGTDNLAQEGAHALLEKDMVERLNAIGMKTNLVEQEELGPFQLREGAQRIRNIETINQINSWLANRVEQSVKADSIPVILGGDGSLSIASISGVISSGRDISVLWISNHPMNSSPEVTKSWNANRMAFTVLTHPGSDPSLNKDFKTLMSVSKDNPIIDKNKIIHLGINHKSAQATIDHEYYSMEDVETLGTGKVITHIIDELSSKSEKVHVVWDVNSLDLSGVSNYSLGQFTYREALTIAREIDLKLRRKDKLSSIDIVEYCPSREALDRRGETAEWMTDIISNIFGENIFNCLRKY